MLATAEVSAEHAIFYANRHLSLWWHSALIIEPMKDSATCSLQSKPKTAQNLERDQTCSETSLHEIQK